jgi:hypothetical protein
VVGGGIGPASACSAAYALVQPHIPLTNLGGGIGPASACSAAYALVQPHKRHALVQ